MKPTPGLLVLALAALPCACLSSQAAKVADVVVRVQTPMDPPRWATLERQLLADNVPAAREFFESLGNTKRYAFLYHIRDAKRPDTRAKRIAEYVELLRVGKTHT